LTIAAAALTFMVSPVSAQDRMPPIPPEKYDPQQKFASTSALRHDFENGRVPKDLP
jgi:hypothetical protein